MTYFHTAQSSMPVLVVGAGPVGLTLAAELTRHCVPCRIIDKAAPRPIVESRAVGVHTRTLETFERLGVLQTALEQGRIARGASFYGDGQQLVHLRLDELDVPYPFSLLLEQGKTERLLVEHLASQGLTVERPVELIALTQEGDRVHATLRHEDGRIEEVTTAYLVGCDGAHSIVRHLIGVSFPGHPHVGQYALADVDVEWDRIWPDDQIHTFLRPEGLLILGRLPSGVWRIVVTLPDDQARIEDKQAILALIKHQLTYHPDAGIRELHTPLWISTFHISSRVVEHMRYGRVFLAGDAAHIHSPESGQGMNAGMQDATNLAWKLALHVRGLGGEALLDSYHAERHPIVVEIVRTTELVERLLELKQPLAAKVRNATLSLAWHVDAIERQMRNAFAANTYNYRHSPLVGEHTQSLFEWWYAIANTEPYPSAGDRFDFSHGPTAGDRAPDARNIVTQDGQLHRLFEIWGNEARHHLLVFAGLKEQPQRLEELRQIVAFMQSRYGTLIQCHLVLSQQGNNEQFSLWDSTGELSRRYGAQFECLYLVRPDGYVGFRSQPAQLQPLEAFLVGLLGKSVELTLN
ncbi:hypothetical protein A6769_30810 [Nostoc punctiforme NIES-2108]|uniref:FAD-binding domain-containing protein n=1 Tax=Nostoc punctiforme NIES-2108 TaxID=1356359 RepID=A0A367R5P3_NOSPU|nr:hypothetical protein A6769_30810 [Nostoc punctiforme NIES-2108]